MKHLSIFAACLIALFLCSCATPQMAPPPPNQPVPGDGKVAKPPMPRDMTLGTKKGPLNSLKDVTIVIDPGHGGDDFGTHSNGKPVYHEKNLNLATARMLRGFLDRMGYTTIMTRDEDVFIDLHKRAEFANKQKPTLFVSVHYNSAPSKEADGVEVFFYRSETDKGRTASSRQLAKHVLDGVIGETGAKQRGIKHGNFAVIRETDMPAILIESGFLTNDGEMEKIKDPVYMKKIAWGISQGIDKYLTNPPTADR